MMVKTLIIVVLVFSCFADPVSAHSPYLIRGETEITVSSPEISKAYYGWLQGSPAVYLISSAKPFLLYAKILSPQMNAPKMDYSIKIFRGQDLLITVSNADALWLMEYEPFANDYYAKGPEYEAQMPAGDYQIEIYNSGNSGNYTLAIGKTEDLSLASFFHALWVLPGIKAEFFGKNPWEAYNNFLGLGALIVLAVLAVIVYFTFTAIKRWRLKKRLDNEYGKYKNNRFAG